MNIQDILLKYWGFSSFKTPQKEIIESVLAKDDTLAILPTGGGKSLCYQLPALATEGVCIVVTPLLALMHDQIKGLQEKGIKALAITSTLNQEETIVAFDNLQYGNYKFLYISPEKLQSEFILQKIAQLNVNLITVDEAHCISEWGQDFRPAYLKIHILKTLNIEAPTIALTATATPRVIGDIRSYLDIKDAKIFSKSLVRPSLAYKVLNSENARHQVLSILEEKMQAAIIYVRNRKKTKEIADFLNNRGLTSTYYHGGQSQEERQAAFLAWKEEKALIMVATNAFGMGIDKGNVSTILHLDIPQSLESYMQEAGRAGRNGKAAEAYIISSPHAISNLKEQFIKNEISVEDAKIVYKNLNHFFQIAFGELNEDLHDFDIDLFSEHYGNRNAKIKAILKLLEREELLLVNDGFSRKSTFRFTASSKIVLDYSKTNNATLIPTLLRSHGGLFEHTIAINEHFLAKKMGCTISEVKQELNKFEKDGIGAYTSETQKIQIQFLVPREDDRTINTIATRIKQQNAVREEKMNATIAYVENTSICRSVLLVSYFQEVQGVPCGICDICLNKNNTAEVKSQEYISKEILEIMSATNEITIADLVKKMGNDTDAIMSTLRFLLDTDKINLTSQNKLEKAKND